MIRVGLCTGGCVTITPERIDVSAVKPETIAHGLARVGRFGGQTPEMYSVSEHSCLIYDWMKANGVAPIWRVAALLHDGPECLGVGDVQRFVKREYAEQLRAFDRQMNVALWDQLKPDWCGGLGWDYVEAVVHRYDVMLGVYEANFFGFPCEEKPGSPPPRKPRCWYPHQAEDEWMERWEDS